MTEQPVQDDQTAELQAAHEPDGLLDPDDRPDYADQLSPALLASGEQERSA